MGSWFVWLPAYWKDRTMVFNISTYEITINGKTFKLDDPREALAWWSQNPSAKVVS